MYLIFFKKTLIISLKDKKKVLLVTNIIIKTIKEIKLQNKNLIKTYLKSSVNDLFSLEIICPFLDELPTSDEVDLRVDVGDCTGDPSLLILWVARRKRLDRGREGDDEGLLEPVFDGEAILSVLETWGDFSGEPWQSEESDKEELLFFDFELSSNLFTSENKQYFINSNSYPFESVMEN